MGIDDESPEPGRTAMVRSLVKLVRDQVDDLLTVRSSLNEDDRRAMIDRVHGLVIRSLRQLSPDDLARVWTIFGSRPSGNDAPRSPDNDDSRQPD